MKKIGCIILILILLLTGCRKPPPLIDVNDASLYINKTVQVEVTPIEEVTSDIQLEFFIIVPIIVSTGKTIIISFILIPIFERYTVYRTKEMLFLGIEKKGKKLELGKPILVIGTIVKEDKGNKLVMLMK